MKPQPNRYYELCGWFGVVCVLGSYVLLSLGLVPGDSYIYHVLILVGSALVALISWRKHVLQPALLNTVFAVLAVVAIVRLMVIS